MLFIFQEPPASAPDQGLKDKDITSLVDKLGFADLCRLYLELDLNDAEVEDAQSQARAPGKLAKALQVFHKWQQREGAKATKMALLQALKECKLIDTMEKMQAEWA